MSFATIDFEDLDESRYYPNVCFDEAVKALAAFVQTAVDLGVKYTVREIKALAFSLEGQCTEYRNPAEEWTCAPRGHIFLMATGASTKPLLSQTTTRNKKLHAGYRVVDKDALCI